MYKYKEINVITTPIMPNKRIRGLALYWVIVVRTPVNGVVRSSSGSKTLQAVLAHEYTHIERQRALGGWRWFYRYVTDKTFRENEEKIAIEAEKG